MQYIYHHYTHYKGEWPWANFKPQELACKHCGELYLDPESMDCLQSLREAWGKPITITSAHRCVLHNQTVGGSPNSHHLKIAFDCACPAGEQPAFIKAATAAGFTGIGRYPGKGFVHVDTGPKRTWAG